MYNEGYVIGIESRQNALAFSETGKSIELCIQALLHRDGEFVCLLGYKEVDPFSINGKQNAVAFLVTRKLT